MKKAAILALLALELAVSGCGSSNSSTSTSTSASGNWEAQLSGGTGAASELNFVTALTVTDTSGVSNQPLNITGFSFINAGACFVSGETESGTATLTTSSTNQVTGTMTFTVKSGTPPGNTLTLTGNVTGTANGTSLTGGVVAGTWTLNGGGDTSCNGQGGSFIMCQNAATCTVP
jgi:hypothetical protein